MAKKESATIDIVDVNQSRMEIHLLGDSPLIYHAMSQKAYHELLLPKGKKSAAEKAITLKHDPLKEFRDSMYYARDKEGPTRLVAPSIWFKKAIMSAALDTPGATKAKIGRLVYVIGDEVPVYGNPEVMMTIVRSADMNRTPDVRTRAILPTWYTKMTVAFAEPALTGAVLTKLAAAAGITSGVGDWRVQKGSGNYGRFIIVSPEHPQVKLLVDAGAKAAQDEAIKEPVAYDSETESLLDWFQLEVKRRGIKEVV